MRTSQIMTAPSSPPEATTESLCGFQSVSRTGAVWERHRGRESGSLEGMGEEVEEKGEGRGRMPKAPPPPAFQLMEM